jgi:hypothetical protein
LYLPQVLVSQDRGGLHRDSVWKPKATSKDITGGSLNVNTASNPAMFDGDHVLVGFYDDNLNTPIILRGIPHPSADVGNEDKTAGHRLRLKLADGDPEFVKHKGAFYGIDDSGDFVIDLREAYAGDTDASGNEPEAAGDGTTGNMNVKLPEGSKITITLNDEPLGVLELSGANAKLTLGDGSKSVAIAETLQAFYGTLKTYIEAAIVPTGLGPSGNILAGSGPAPTWDAAIASTKLKIPNG